MSDPFIRIYWRFADEFPDVYQDDAALALYGRLLRLADMSWPSLATLPYGARKAALTMLTTDREGGPLVQLVTASTYRMRGMTKERAQRTESARNAAVNRWSDAETMRGASKNDAETMRGASKNDAEPMLATRATSTSTSTSTKGIQGLSVQRALAGTGPVDPLS